MKKKRKLLCSIDQDGALKRRGVTDQLRGQSERACCLANADATPGQTGQQWRFTQDGSTQFDD
jgi:hypothetical protein